jgi:hypothetical protein
MSGEKTSGDILSDMATDALNQVKLAAGLITGTTPLTPGNVAAAVGLNPNSAGDRTNTVGGQLVGGAGSTENAKKAMTFFMASGWNREQAAGIVGNLQQESTANLDPKAQNSIGMYGIAQWDKTRRATFQSVYKKSIYNSSFQDQLNYVQYELTQGRYKSAGRAIHGAKNAADAANIVNRSYEVAVGQNDDKRVANAIALTSTKEKGSSPNYTEPTSYKQTMPKPRPMKQTKIAQTQQYGIPSPYAMSTVEDRISVFFNANEPMMGVGMST